MKKVYTLKIYAFRDQFELDEDFCQKFQRLAVFFALYYVPHWLNTSLGIDDPSNDLQFYKSLHKFKAEDEEIAQVAITALNRHMWYLTEELAPLSLFSNKVSDQEKGQIAKQIIKHKMEYSAEESMGQPTFPTVTNTTQLKVTRQVFEH